MWFTNTLFRKFSSIFLRETIPNFYHALSCLLWGQNNRYKPQVIVTPIFWKNLYKSRIIWKNPIKPFRPNVFFLSFFFFFDPGLPGVMEPSGRSYFRDSCSLRWRRRSSGTGSGSGSRSWSALWFGGEKLRLLPNRDWDPNVFFFLSKDFKLLKKVFQMSENASGFLFLLESILKKCIFLITCPFRPFSSLLV